MDVNDPRYGTFKVMRDCRTSGNCVMCRHVTELGKPVRVTQMDKLSSSYAKEVAHNWRTYNATVEPMA